MAGLETEFHATIDELTGVVESWLHRYPVFVSAFSFPPNAQVPMTRETLRDVLNRPDVCALVFTECPPHPCWTSAYEVACNVESSLRLNVGRISPAGLTQSSLSTRNATPTWQKMNRELKKVTTAGATLFYENGARPFDRNARFTAGAKALAAAGTPLREHAHAMRFMYMPK